ncbi:MAG: pyridoxal phosphate-dependent aminotransferase [Dehalococcoidia bacterium]|nr:pyridoxal phosphate-dependent aminotransferase [Dehalococcoidia bacterium]
MTGGDMLAQRMARLGTETAFEVLARAKALEAQGRDIIHLEIGEPDFPTPAHIVEAAYRALQEGYTHYTPSAGLAEVREGIARHARQRLGIPVAADQVVITPGAKPIIFYTILALAEEGSEVLYPDPGFPIYASVVTFCGATPVPLPLDPSRGYHLDLDDLERKLSPRTRLLILNSPHNPTGSALTAEELKAIADLLRRWEQVYVLSDEVYHAILYNGRYQSIASLPGMAERTIVLDGLSKTYAMTGWRLGWGIFPKTLVEPVVRLVINSVSCAPAFVQKAALAALDGPQDSVQAMVAEFRARRDLIVAGLRALPGVVCPLPEGAFYAFPDIRGTGLTSRELERRALEEAGVALLSGTAFGQYGEGFIRLSYANSRQNIARALERLEALLKRARR